MGDRQGWVSVGQAWVGMWGTGRIRVGGDRQPAGGTAGPMWAMSEQLCWGQAGGSGGAGTAGGLPVTPSVLPVTPALLPQGQPPDGCKYHAACSIPPGPAPRLWLPSQGPSPYQSRTSAGRGRVTGLLRCRGRRRPGFGLARCQRAAVLFRAD